VDVIGGIHPGTAFTELRFYPPAWVKQFHGRSCAARDWCAALTIGSLSPAQLARDSFVRPQSTADLVANLERRNLVRRDRNPANRRELVSLTPKGRRLLARYTETVAALEKDMTSGLDPDDIETFRSYLDACRVALNRPGT
jgi:DNA-binding MarR family transcriptional regulator